MPNETYFTITNDAWQLTAEASNGLEEQITVLPPDPTFETFDVLQAELDAIPDGGTLDLTGRYFGPTHGGTTLLSENSIITKTIKNGAITGSLPVVWELRADVDDFLIGDLETQGALQELSENGVGTVQGEALPYLIDFSGNDADAFIAVWPAPPQNRKRNGAAMNQNWFKVSWDDNPASNPLGEIILDAEDVILGWRITDTDAAETIRTKMATLTVPITSITACFRSGANQVEDQFLTGYTDNGASGVEFTINTTMGYTGYFDFGLTGDRSFITQRGQYVVEYNGNSDSRIIWDTRTNGNTTRLSYYGNAVTTDKTNGVLTFDGTYFSGCSRKTGSPAIVLYPATSWDVYDLPAPPLVFENCEFAWAHHATRFYGKANKCYWHDVRDYHISTCEGSTFTRNDFRSCERLSAISCLGRNSGDGDDDLPLATIVAPLIVEHNAIDCQITAHGQGLTMYTSAYLNATVEHNLFMNCTRAIAFKYGNGNLSSDFGIRTTPGVTKVRNNMMLYDQPTAVGSRNGQGIIHMQGPGGFPLNIDPNGEPFGWPTPNTGPYPTLQYGRQYFLIQNNTIAYNPYDATANPKQGGLKSTIGMNIAHEWSSKPMIVDNIMGYMVGPPTTADLVASNEFNKVHQYFDDPSTYNWQTAPSQNLNNIWHTPISVPCKATSDTAIAYDENETVSIQEAVFNYNDLQPASSYATAAHDSGRPGARWANYPTIFDLRASTRASNWYDLYPAETLLDIAQTETFNAVFNGEFNEQ